ncbi:MAG TPA: hypothetical protein VMT70_18535 [Vicinamibacteria bacterium]|nr:hypothetical protein [Vicinamibacteria bacterium]
MCTTSSSRRKRRTTGWSRSLVLPAALALVSCGGTARETFVTYFNGDHAVSLRHPASWRTDQAEQDGVWYRYFLAPPEDAQGRAPVSVTLMAGAMAVPVEEYAKSYLAGHTVASTRPEERQGIPGQSWVFASADGKSRYRLLLLALGGRVVGLYAQGDSAAVERQSPVLDEMWSSLTVERPDRYPVTTWKDQQASLGLPASWRETRRFSGGGTLLAQFVSPALAVDKGRQTVHASLSVTFEAVPEGGGLDAYYDAARGRLGQNFQVTNHSSFKNGYVDVMRTETPLAVSFVKRFYFARKGRGCSLSFEAREDVFPRASRWADYIASTLTFGDAGTASK